MDTNVRLITKTISWQILGFFTMMIISYLHTGTIVAATSLAISSTLSGLCFYFLHEKVWQGIHWGKSASPH